jgi:hypothetical protein
MPNGDDALAAGMNPVDPSTDLVKEGYDAINYALDQIALRTNDVTPVSEGGTGSTNPTGARLNLEIEAANVPATGAGGDDVQQILDFLDVVKVSNVTAGTNTVQLGWIAGRLRIFIDSTNQGDIANVGDLGNKVNRSGDTMTGDLTAPNIYIPGASAGGSGTIAYVQNSDSRITRGVSARKYKKNIRALDPESVGDIFPELVEYEMKVAYGGDGAKFIGYIADDMVGTDADRFVTYRDGEIDAIDVIQLLLAQNAQLNARLAALENGE